MVLIFSHVMMRYKTKNMRARAAITANRFRWLKVDTNSSGGGGGGGGGSGGVLTIKPKLDCSTGARRMILCYVHHRGGGRSLHYHRPCAIRPAAF
jgi:hypothetical protein